MTTIRELIEGSVEQGYIDLTVELSRKDLEAYTVLSYIATIKGTDTSLGDAEAVLLVALWWVQTLGSIDFEKADEGEEEE